MNNSEDRARLREVGGAQSPIPAPRPPAPAPDQPRAVPLSPLPWSNVVDGWVRDSKVRRDALIGLTLMLLAAVVAICAVTGALGPFIKNAVGNTAIRIVAGSLLTGGALGYGGLRLHRRRGRQTEGGGGGTTDPDG